MNTGRRIGLLALLGLLWVSLAGALVVSDIPWSNEAWSALPAWNLANHGFLGDTILASKGFWLQGLDRHAYWIMPLHSLVQAVWYKLLGFGLFRQRALSVLFGALALAAWFLIVRRLTGKYWAALLALLLIGFERNFLNAAANGRMDMMAASLGACALAAFLELRQRAPGKAIWISHSLAAAAVFTHPCGVLFAASLLTVMWQTQTLKLPALAGIVTPYLVGLSLWAVYIAQAPHDFQTQLFGNVSGFAGEYLHRQRFSGLRAPWQAVADELRLRYWGPFGFASLRNFASALTAAWLFLAAAAAAFAVLNPNARREPAVRILGSCAVVVFALMALLESMKFQHYLVYSLPFLAALTAVIGARFFRRGLLGACAAAALALMLLPQVAGVVRHYHRNPLRTEYQPVAAFIASRLRPGDHVIAPAELGYALGFTQALSDDVRLGYYTGLQPRFIVTSDWYRAWAANAGEREPETYRYIQEELQARDRLLTSGDYVVYGPSPR